MVNLKSFTEEVLIAAGGILSRQTPDGVEIAVIHRPKYGDWCLPKGKVEENETIRETALREVREETQCEAVISGFADTTTYMVKNKPKVVYFWNMELTEENEFKRKNEIDERLWLPPEKAVKKLTHEEERRIIREQFRLRRRRSWLVRAWGELTQQAQSGDIRAKRLRASIDTYSIELSRKVQVNRDLGNLDAVQWLASAQESLRAAESSLSKKELDIGWRCYHAARSLAVFAMNGDELRNEAIAIEREAGKINREWREKSIQEILGDKSRAVEALTKLFMKRGAAPDQTKPEKDAGVDPMKLEKEIEKILSERPKPPSPLQVFKAMQLLYEHFDNIYHKIGLFRRQLTILAISLFIVIVAVIIMAGFCYFPAIGNDGTVEADLVIGVIVFGLLGGSVSTVFSFFRTPKSTTVMDTVATGSTTILRILVGAASALVIYVLARSPLFDQIFSLNTENNATIFFLAFVAGFNERMVKRAVGHLAESKE